ncbi:MAG: hypothetical protein FJ145_02275 [Deltaproteobacteria bacterium]|nr:hypothetical protein [Deltaproteobacteria bacterium]
MWSSRSIGLALAAVALLVAPALWLWSISAPAPGSAPLQVVRAYLRALQARDFHQAYRHISTLDRQARDEASYLRAQESNRGFALRLARKAASYGSVHLRRYTVDAAGLAEIGVAYRFPSLDELTPLYRSDAARLNQLSRHEQGEIFQQLENRQREGKLISVEGQENLRLTKDPTGWKIVLGWAQGLPVKLSVITDSKEIEGRLAQSEIVVSGEEPFQVYLTLRNHGTRAQRATLLHRVEPPSLGEELAMIECGLSRPVTLAPKSEREFAMAYLLGANARQSAKALELSYRIETSLAP